VINAEALQDFLRSLRLALKTSSLYPPEHPAFKKSAAELKEKADILLGSLPSLKIRFTPHALVVDGKTWEKDRVWEELAYFFHVRLILNLDIKPGVSVEDWLRFIRLLSRSPRDIARGGGIRCLLEKEKIAPFHVEELDYSELLSAEGMEIKDVWMYLLSDALREPTPQKIRRAAMIFPRALVQLNLNEFLADRDQVADLGRFFSLLREEEEEKLDACGEVVVKKILREEVLPTEGQLAGLSEVFARMKDQHLARLLLEAMAQAERFQPSSLGLFWRLLGEERCPGVARSFEEEAFKDILELSESSLFEVRLRAFLEANPPTSPPSPIISPFREAFSAVLDQISRRERPSIDPALLSSSFRFMLLNILAGQASREGISACLAALHEEWKKIAFEKDFVFLEALYETLEKKAEALAEQPLFRRIREELADYIEKSLLSGEVRPELEHLLRRLPSSRLGLNYYLTAIFEERIVTPAILRTFFHLFANDIFYFNLNLDQEKSNRRFLEKLTACLAEVDSPLSLATLKHIYSLGDDHIKVRALEAMERLSACDENFLLALLRKADFALKRRALVILHKDPGAREKALRILFHRPWPFGIKNRTLLQHLRIVEELDLREAAGHVVRLERRRFFWNRRLRREAGNLLRKWSFGQA